jgi:iron(III) transport system substrate-binding protein
MTMTRRTLAAGLMLGTAGLAAGCRPRPPEAVTVYCSLDEPYSSPILAAFERETGIRARPVYDTEANKSRGLAQRVLAERGRPLADVFWSSEVLQMLSLREAGVLQAYRSPVAAGIPPRFRDPDGFWTGFAARFRALAVAPDADPPPAGLLELAEPRWRGRVVMAQPLFGTTTTEVAALFQVLGSRRAQAFYRALKANGLRLVDGNSAAAEQVARGDAAVGLTDTDDIYSRLDRGRALRVIFPDQAAFGALLIPNTVALVAGGPRPDLGRRVIDYLLRPETELALAALPSRQLPLHQGLSDRVPARVRPLARVRPMRVDYPRLREQLPTVEAFLRETMLE